MSEPLLLLRRLGCDPDPGPTAAQALVLSLSATERQRLRGHVRSRCGRDLLLQLPRGEALAPGEWLADGEGQARVRVEAAPEQLLVVASDDPLTLLRAAYHLGNRHVALEVHAGELRLLEDPVLADLLRGLGVRLERRTAPFRPEGGAYGGGHSHAHAHAGGHAHDPSQTPAHGQAHPHSHGASPGHGHSHAPADDLRPNGSDPAGSVERPPVLAADQPGQSDPGPAAAPRP